MPHKMMNSQIADVLHDNRLSIEARISKTGESARKSITPSCQVASTSLVFAETPANTIRF